MLDIIRISANEISEFRNYISDHREDWNYLIDEEYLDWQFGPGHYLNNKKNSEYFIYLAKEHNKTLGTICYIPFNFCYRGEILRAAWPTNWYVSKELNRNDIGINLLIKLLSEDFDVIHLMGPTKIAQKIYEKLNYTLLGPMPRWFAIVNKEEFRKLGKIANPDLRDSSHNNIIESHLLRNVKNTKFQNNVKKVSILDQKWDDFWETNLINFIIGANKDSEYLNWRYFMHPILDYKALISFDKEYNGILIYRIEKEKNNGIKIIRILEFIWFGESYYDLMNALIEIANKNGVAFIDFFCYSKSIKFAMKELKFGTTQRLDNYVLPSRFQPMENYEYKLVGMLNSKRKHFNKFEEDIPNSLYSTKSDSDMDSPR